MLFLAPDSWHLECHKIPLGNKGSPSSLHHAAHLYSTHYLSIRTAIKWLHYKLHAVALWEILNVWSEYLIFSYLVKSSYIKLRHRIMISWKSYGV